MIQEILRQSNWRYAVKQFDPNQKLSEEQVQLVKSVLRLSPSSFGLQLWKFLFVEDQHIRSQLRAQAWNQSQVEDASHLVVFCRPASVGPQDVERFMSHVASIRQVPVETLAGYASVVNSFISKFSPDEANAWMDRQIYLAMGNLLACCAMAGIDACPMEGFESKGVDSILGLPEKGLRAVVLCAVGFRAENDKYAKLRKVRYPEEAIISTI